MSDTIIVCPSSGAICKHAECAAGPCWAMAWEQPVRYVRAAPPPAADAVSVDGLMEAMNGPKGELDAWLEARDEAEVRAAIAAALAARGTRIDTAILRLLDERDAMERERDAVLAANRDCLLHFDVLKAERDALVAMLRDRPGVVRAALDGAKGK